MKQLKTVFAFEFLGYVKRKSFLVLTVVLMLIIGGVLSWPRLKDTVGFGGSAANAEQETIALAVEQGAVSQSAEELAKQLNGTLEEYGFVFVPMEATKEQLKEQLETGDTFDAAVVLDGPLSYTRIVKNIAMMDMFPRYFEQELVQLFRTNTLESLGLQEAEVEHLLNAEVESQTVTTENGKNQQQNFFYTYMLVFLLYFAVVMYGNFVSSSVATEKSTRAMELLITSTDTNSLLFGKVLGAGFAGILQFVCILGSGYVFYNINAAYHVDNMLVQSLFSMPIFIMLYTILFFVLGFFIYAFLYAGLASMVSRLEDLGTATMPVTYTFVIAFMVVMFSMASGNVDSTLMIVCSFIPLTSPMAMFTRIAMGTVAPWEIILSVVILIASTVGIGLLASSLYRLGVLLYGNTPKPKEIIRMLRNSKQSR